MAIWREPRRLEISPVTREVLPVLGVNPALGRVFDAREDDRSAIVISYGLWQSQFGGSPAVLGQVVNLSGAAHTIVGVIPAAFQSIRVGATPDGPTRARRPLRNSSRPTPR